MKISLGFNVIFDSSVYEAIDFAADHGFSAIELWVSTPHFFPERYTKRARARIAAYSRAKNIQIQIHGPEDVSLFAYLPEVRKATLDYFKRLIDFANDIGAKTLTIHPGKITTFTFPEKSGMALFDFYPKYFLPIFRQNLEVLGTYAKNKVVLCLENTDHFEPPILKILEPLIKKKLIFLTWDIVKSYKKDGTIKAAELRFLLRNIKGVRNVHLHDFNKKWGHSHGVIGTGFVDIRFFLKKLQGRRVNYIIEVRPHSNVLKSQKFLRQVLKLNNSE